MDSIIISPKARHSLQTNAQAASDKAAIEYKSEVHTAFPIWDLGRRKFQGSIYQ